MTEATKKGYNKVDEAGRLYKDYGGNRSYLDTKHGRVVPDWWDDIPGTLIHAQGEVTNYPTQKPLAIANRIIQASSNVGDWVVDPFAGSGTTLVAAEILGRRWMGADEQRYAIDTILERIETEAWV